MDNNQQIELFKRLIQGDMSAYGELFPNAKEGDKEECAKFLKHINNLETIEGLYRRFLKFIISNIDCSFTPVNTEFSKDPMFRDLLSAAIKGDKTSVEKLNEYFKDTS